MHPDALKQIDDRKEPIDTIPGETRVDHYTQDTNADPEGAARRENAMAMRDDPFPGWIYQDMDLSWKDFWGKPWTDKMQHLIPKQSLVDDVIAIHVAGMETIGNMFTLATGKDNIESLKLIQGSFSTMLGKVDSMFHFPLMQALQNCAQTALAERAFAKYQYVSALQRNMRDDDTTQPKDLPDYVESLQSRMIAAATSAGTWCHVHMEMWRQLEWANTPKYDNITGSIKLRCVNHARWLDQRFRRHDAPRPKMADHLKLAINC